MEKNIKKLILLIIVVLILALIFFAFIFYFKNKITGKEKIIHSSPSGKELPEEILDEKYPDSDKDGLKDDEEKKLNTNPLSSDSDRDGLSDSVEVRLYFTDPLNPDTDGDGYSDGEEAKKGYNPKGKGKLPKPAQTSK